MIYHYNDNLQGLSYTLGKPLTYSSSFSFIPLRIKGNAKEFIIQTPKVFVPFGIQENDNSKEYIMISFQNKVNDTPTKKFMEDLEYIYQLINDHFKDSYQVNSFVKEYKGEQIMNIKVNSTHTLFDSSKNVCEDLPIYSYASFILQCAGLWISGNQVWFQWYSHQIRLENYVSLKDYAFKDSIPRAPPPPPPPAPPPPPRQPIDKYKKMITMGIPSAAVNQRKQIDAKASINPQMLLSVQLKKGRTKDILPSDMNGFEPPSLDSLQRALQNLRNTIKGT